MKYLALLRFGMRKIERFDFFIRTFLSLWCLSYHNKRMQIYQYGIQ